MSIDPWKHSHDYAVDSASDERRTRFVIAITATMMVVEIAAGIVFGSMALLADGWHMSTHVAAFLITAMAYHFSRPHATDPRYSFGTAKMGLLGGFGTRAAFFWIAPPKLPIRRRRFAARGVRHGRWGRPTADILSHGVSRVWLRWPTRT